MPWIDEALRVLGLGWIGGLLGIGGLIFGYVSYVRSRKRTKMAYVHLGEHLLGSAADTLPPLINVLYDGISIPRLTKTLIIIWNNGENTINGADIVPKDPLRLQVGSDGEILSVSLLKTSRAVTDFQIACAENTATNEALLKFDFLDANDGVVVEILHTSTDRQPRISGTLRGLPQGFTNLGQFTRPKPQKKIKKQRLSRAAFLIALICVAGTGFLTAIYDSPLSISDIPARSSSLSSGALGGVAGFICTWAFNAFISRRRYPKSLHLQALE